MVVTENYHTTFGATVDTIRRGCFEISVLDYFSSLLRVQYDIKVGFISPSVLFAHAQGNVNLDQNQVVQENVDAFQIHYIDSHYVVSAQQGSVITVYDSLPSGNRITSLMPQLKLLYKALQSENISGNIGYVVAQNQGSTDDCGPFAIYNAYMLC